MIAAFLVLAFALTAKAQFVVRTEAYDNNRSSANTQETILNTSNVNVAGFGKLFSRPLDATPYAQPLYVPGLTINGGLHNVVYVATMNNSLYAFDANTGASLWQVNLGTPGSFTWSGGVFTSGILATPVIDPGSGTIYVVALTGGNYHLHALNISSGAEKFNGPVLITGNVGSLAFAPTQHLQRPALALANGNVYVAFGSFADLTVWHGWVMAYSASTLSQTAIYCTTPTATDGAIWMSGGGPVIDSSGNLLYSTGNGLYDGVSNFGDSIVKLSPSLSLLDWFTPDNFSFLQGNDEDLGSSSPLMIPGTNIVVAGGKDGNLYVLNTPLGKEAPGNSQIIQSMNIGSIFSAPAFWNGELYLWSTNLEAYPFNGSSFNLSPVSQGTVLTPASSFAPAVSISANGNTAGTGIVWALGSSTSNNFGSGPAILYAFDAANLAHELWDSNQNASRDGLGFSVKWRQPIVANGDVYVTAAPNSITGTPATLNAYGLLIPPGSAGVATSAVAQFVGTDTATQGRWQGKYGTAGYDIEGLPANLPSNISYTVGSNSSLWQWAYPTSDSRALVVPGDAWGIAACWYTNGASTYRFNTNFTDSSTHQVALYVVDWDSKGRSETIQISDTSGNVLNTQSIKTFVSGEYLVWDVTGNVVFSVTSNTGPNAVVSGIFFDPASGSVTPPPPPPINTTITVQLPSGVTATIPGTVTILPGQNQAITITLTNSASSPSLVVTTAQ